MKPTILVPFLLACAFLLPRPAAAQSEAELKRLDALDQACEAAREKKLAPLRAARIERCVREDRRSREECTAELANWGQTQGTKQGARAGLFYDLPECVAAFEARQQYRR